MADVTHKRGGHLPDHRAAEERGRHPQPAHNDGEQDQRGVIQQDPVHDERDLQSVAHQTQRRTTGT